MSFRQYGGINYAAKNNVVKNNYSNVNNLSVMTKVGQPNTYINFESDISGNILIYGDFDLSGNLYVAGDIDCSGNLYVDGNAYASSFQTPSDYRIKKNIKILDESFTIDSLKPVTYFNKKTEKQDIGLIAHELQEIYPFLVTGEKDGENLQAVNYIGLISILIKEIQELKKEVKILKKY
jgi:hypothetical protein